MRVFGIDPGSDRTGYGCVDSDGRTHRLVLCGAIRTRASDAFPDKLGAIHQQLSTLIAECHPDCVAIENLFHAVNVRSALKLGHARGVAMLAAVQAGVAVVEYTPAEIKRAVVGYGRAEKPQVQQMVKLLLRLPRVPSPHDAADALAVAICHLHASPLVKAARAALTPGTTNRLRQGSGESRQSEATAEAVPSVTGKAVPSVTAGLKSWRQYRPRAHS